MAKNDLTDVATRLAQMEERVEKLRLQFVGGEVNGQPVEGVIPAIESLDDRLEAVEKAAVILETVTEVPLPEVLVQGVRPQDIFCSVLSSVLEASFKQAPQIMLDDKKPDTRNRYIGAALEMAFQAVNTAAKRIPSWNKNLS